MPFEKKMPLPFFTQVNSNMPVIGERGMTTGRGEKKAQEGKIRSGRGKTFLHHTTATKHPGFEERDRGEKGERGGY